jgi:hypothetical protein
VQRLGGGSDSDIVADTLPGVVEGIDEVLRGSTVTQRVSIAFGARVRTGAVAEDGGSVGLS